ncbi:MAG: hypothetical protein ACK5Q5_01905 [Planctomycetaceae bacterium]
MAGRSNADPHSRTRNRTRIRRRGQVAVDTRTDEKVRNLIYLFLSAEGPHPLDLIADHVGVPAARAQQLLNHSWFVATPNGLWETRNSRERTSVRSCAATVRADADDIEGES